MLVEIIKPGVLVRNNIGMILQASSTVTLVQGDGHNIIIDTGLPGERETILQGLSDHGLSANDVDMVINTHLHVDHIGNNPLFGNARFIVHIKEFFARLKDVTTIDGDYEISDNIKIIETPGHSPGSISVIVDNVDDSKTYVIAGDALPTKDNYLAWVPPAINFDPIVAIASMKRIVNLADLVIPGHDDMFRID